MIAADLKVDHVVVADDETGWVSPYTIADHIDYVRGQIRMTNSVQVDIAINRWKETHEDDEDDNHAQVLKGLIQWAKQGDRLSDVTEAKRLTNGSYGITVTARELYELIDDLSGCLQSSNGKD